MFFREDFSKRTVVQLRWALIIVIGYIVVFVHSGKPFSVTLNVLCLLYASTNLLISFGPKKWFRQQRFMFLILLLDLIVTTAIIFLAGPDDSGFYTTFFLLLLISAVTRSALPVYLTFGLILLAYGVSLYLKAPEAFFSTAVLLQFPFIILIALFFRSIVVSYNRVHQEKRLLEADYRELELLNNVALSIGQYKDLSKFLFKLSKLLAETLGLKRCTAIFMDSSEDNCYMVSSDDSPGEESHWIDIKDFPSLKESLKSEDVSKEEQSFPVPLSSSYILKKIPVSFKDASLGTLYLRANTPQHDLTRREEYFLEVLGRITAIAILDVEKSMSLKMADTIAR